MKKNFKIIMMIAAIVIFTSCKEAQSNKLQISEGAYNLNVHYEGTALTIDEEAELMNEIANLIQSEDAKLVKKVKSTIKEMDKRCTYFSLKIQIPQGEKFLEKDYEDEFATSVFMGIVFLTILFVAWAISQIR